VEAGAKGNSQVPRSFRCLRGGGATVHTDYDYSTQIFTSSIIRSTPYPAIAVLPAAYNPGCPCQLASAVRARS
jgi:hypothetical protein